MNAMILVVIERMSSSENILNFITHIVSYCELYQYFKNEINVRTYFTYYYGNIIIICSSYHYDQFPSENWWVFVVLLLLVGNVEVTAFKALKTIIKVFQF